MRPKQSSYDFAFVSLRPWLGPLKSRFHHVAHELARRGLKVLYVEPVVGQHVQTESQTPLIQDTGHSNITRLRLVGGRRLSLSDPNVINQVLGVSCNTLNRNILSGIKVGLVAFNFPACLALATMFCGDRLLFEMIDDYVSYFPNLERLTLESIDAAEAVTAVSEKLGRRYERLTGRAISVIPNGVEPCPREVSEERSGVVYLGTVNQRIDTDLLEFLANAVFPEQVSIIGPRQLRWEPTRNCNNIEHIGVLPYAEAMKRLNGYKVGIIPFTSDDFSTNCCPMKALEYLSQGLEVVSTEVHGLKHISEHIHLCKTREEFVSAALKGLQMPSSSQIGTKNALLLAENSWSRVTDRILESIND